MYRTPRWPIPRTRARGGTRRRKTSEHLALAQLGADHPLRSHSAARTQGAPPRPRVPPRTSTLVYQRLKTSKHTRAHTAASHQRLVSASAEGAIDCTTPRYAASTIRSCILCHSRKFQKCKSWRRRAVFTISSCTIRCCTVGRGARTCCPCQRRRRGTIASAAIHRHRCRASATAGFWWQPLRVTAGTSLNPGRKAYPGPCALALTSRSSVLVIEQEPKKSPQTYGSLSVLS